MYELRPLKNKHAQYKLEYHLILVTKYRKKCISQKIFDFLKEETERLCFLKKIDVLEMNYETDHIHLLLSIPPQICLSTFINNYKSVTSRHIRLKFEAELKKYYWKSYFWSRSYLILSSGGAPIEVIKKYIQNQKHD